MIVILGILAGIVVFAVGNLTSNAKTNACATEKSTISTALEAYKAQTGAYPATSRPRGDGLLTEPAPSAASAPAEVDAGRLHDRQRHRRRHAIAGNASGCT